MVRSEGIIHFHDARIRATMAKTKIAWNPEAEQKIRGEGKDREEHSKPTVSVHIIGRAGKL